MEASGEKPRISTANLIETALAALLAACWSAYRLWGLPVVERLYDQQTISFFQVPNRVRAKATVEDCYQWGGQLLGGLAVVALLIAIAHVAAPKGGRRLAQALPRLALSWGFPLAVAATLFVLFNRIAFEGQWYPIDDVMLLQVKPPFRHRILFVTVAWACEYLVPGLSHLDAFFLSQLLAVVLATFAMQAWCRRVATPQLSYFGLTLMALMLVPTFQYYTFYDFGIVLFDSLGLTLLSSLRYFGYAAVVALATLNHEIILFMILISGGIVRSQGATWRRAIGFVMLQLAMYAAIRCGLFWLMPVDRAWEPGKLWLNVDFLIHVRYLAGTAVLMAWFAIAIMVGRRGASAELRWGMLLLPMLIAMTLLVGQINEARQFVAFVPVAVGLILSRINRLDALGERFGAST